MDLIILNFFILKGKQKEKKNISNCIDAFIFLKEFLLLLSIIRLFFSGKMEIDAHEIDASSGHLNVG